MTLRDRDRYVDGRAYDLSGAIACARRLAGLDGATRQAGMPKP